MSEIQVSEGAGAIAQRPPSKPASIRETLESPEFAKALAKVMPKHLTADRFVRVAILAMTRTPKLADCTKASVFNALMLLSQYGLEPDGRRAHLIPYGKECQLIIDYKGLAELAQRSGLVSNIHADVVCENDIFEYDRGEIRRHIIHFKQPRGEVYAVYAMVRFKDGSVKTDVMTLADVEAIRARSRSGRNGPWVSDWNEMAKKTVFRRLSKWLVLSPEFRDATTHEDEFEGSVVEASDQARRLLPTSSLSQAIGIEEEEPSEQDEHDASPPDSPAAPIQDGAAGPGEAIVTPDISTPDKCRNEVLRALTDRHGADVAFDVMKQVKIANDFKKQADREALYAAAVADAIDFTTGRVKEVA